ncbi:hypothetical protein HG531_008470 [Fusarium graminearum]|nr:hypothetical protein HG531_008470 [Fusarium graminearum]
MTATEQQQDDFSNVSWSEHVHDQQTRSVPDAEEPGHDMNAPGTGLERDAPSLGNEKLECTVDTPIKENDGTKDAFVSYLITTHSTFSSFQRSTTTVRRRFTDFVFLYKQLTRDYPAAAVPPLPDKQRMEYVRGDRFGSDFTTRRANSLQRFLSRLSLHPTLRRAPILHTFLESPDWNATMRSRGSRVSSASDPGSAGVFDNFADTFINAFTKLHRPDRRFLEVKEKSDKLDDDLGHIEKVIARVARREADLEVDLRDLAEQFQKLIPLEPHVEPAVHGFSASIEDTASHLRKLKDMTDQDYLGSLRDMQAYSIALKNLLKAREQKQLDYEQLTEYLNKSTTERDTLQSGHGGGSGAGSFLRAKIEDVRGVDHEQARRERTRKLELRVEELTHEVESARKTSDMFDDEVVKEVADFERIKRIEMKAQLGSLADSHIEFYGEVASIWEKSCFSPCPIAAIIIAFAVVTIVTDGVMLRIIACESITRRLPVIAVIFKRLLVAALGESIIQLSATGSARFVAGSFLACVERSFFFVDELEFVAVVGAVAETTAAGDPEIWAFLEAPKVGSHETHEDEAVDVSSAEVWVLDDSSSSVPLVNVSRILGIASSRNGKMTDHVVRADEINAEITTSGVFNVHGDSDMFHTSQIGVLEHVLSNIKSHSQAVPALGNCLLDMDPGRKVPRLRLDQLPILGLLNQSPGVDLTVSKGVTEFLANCCVLLVGFVAFDGQRGVHGQVLEISPSNDQLSGTLLRVVRVESGSINSSNCDTVDRVGVSIKVTVISLTSTISTGKDVDGSKTTTSLLNRLEHRSSNNNIRVNMVVVVLVHQRFCFVGVADQFTEDTDSSDFGVIGNTNTANIVSGGCDFASTTGAVPVVVQYRGRLGVVVVKIPRTLGEIVGLEIVAVHIETVIYHCDSDILSRNTLQPKAGNVDVVARL